jgi:hypothetical protein
MKKLRPVAEKIFTGAYIPTSERAHLDDEANYRDVNDIHHDLYIARSGSSYRLSDDHLSRKSRKKIDALERELRESEIRSHGSSAAYKQHKELAGEFELAKSRTKAAGGLAKLSRAVKQEKSKRKLGNHTKEVGRYIDTFHQEALWEDTLREKFAGYIEQTIEFHELLDTNLRKDDTVRTLFDTVGQAAEADTLPANYKFEDTEESSMISIDDFVYHTEKPFTSTYKWDQPYAVYRRRNKVLTLNKATGEVDVTINDHDTSNVQNEYEDTDAEFMTRLIAPSPHGYYTQYASDRLNLWAAFEAKYATRAEPEFSEIETFKLHQSDSMRKSSIISSIDTSRHPVR